MRHIPGVNVVAVDPGKLSGVCCVGSGNDVHHYEWEFPQVIDEVCGIVKRAVKYREPIMIAIERFDILANTHRTARTSQHWSIEIIGCLRYLATRHDLLYMVIGRADAKSFGTDEKLRALGWYYTGGEGHANDAARVATLALAATDPSRWRSLVVESGLLREDGD